MLDTLLRASIGGIVMVALIWSLNHALRRASAGTRALLWWCATAKFVVALVWTAPVLLPVLPPPTAEAVYTSDSTVLDSRITIEDARTSDRPMAARPIPWRGVLLALWAVGCAFSVQRGFLRWRRVRHAVEHSAEAPASVQQTAAELSHVIGLRQMPEVRVSSEITTPLVTGLFRAVVLLPTSRLHTMSDRQCRLTLCHELMHVKRADLWLGCLPALAERLFFFHPAAHAAAREYLFWREAACDAAVLGAMGAAPQEYGRLLLELGVARRGTTLAAGGAPWSFSILKRRIVMLCHPPRPSLGSRFAAGGVVGLSLIAIVPFQLSARTTPERTSPSVSEASASAPAQRFEAKVREEKVNFVFFFEEDNITMSGSYPKDVDRARQHRKSGERLLWFRLDGQEYVVRDPAVLREIEGLWIPVNQIGDVQGKLGARQAELGAIQAEVGKRQARVGLEQAKVANELARITERRNEIEARILTQKLTDAQRTELEKQRAALEARLRQLEHQSQTVEIQMHESHKPVEDLEVQITRLDRELVQVAEKMEQAHRRAETGMRALLERAIASGAAERIK